MLLFLITMALILIAGSLSGIADASSARRSVIRRQEEGMQKVRHSMMRKGERERLRCFGVVIEVLKGLEMAYGKKPIRPDRELKGVYCCLLYGSAYVTDFSLVVGWWNHPPVVVLDVIEDRSSLEDWHACRDGHVFWDSIKDEWFKMEGGNFCVLGDADGFWKRW